MSIIEHDVRRLDRLISDISDASRLDAELARDDVDLVDLTRLLDTVVAVANLVKDQGAIQVELVIARHGKDDNRRAPFMILGHDSRLGQVFNNLIDNARSFSGPGGSVRVLLRPAKDYTPQGHVRDGLRSSSMMTGRAFPPMPSNGFSNGFIPTAPAKASGKTPALDFPSRGKSSKSMAATYGAQPGRASRPRWDHSGAWRPFPRVSAAGSIGLARRRRPAHRQHAEKFYLHATAVVIGEAGILIMGPSGAGKSRLALALIAAAEAAGTFARLVGDDRIGIERRGDRLIARGHPAILGKIERRGHGIGEIPFLAAAVVRLVVSLGGEGDAPLPRLPDEAEANTHPGGTASCLL